MLFQITTIPVVISKAVYSRFTRAIIIYFDYNKLLKVDTSVYAEFYTLSFNINLFKTPIYFSDGFFLLVSS